MDDQAWRDKDQLIASTGLPLLQQPIRAHLANLEHQLESRLVEVNERIAAGDNPYFKTIKRGAQMRWTLRYPQNSEPVNHPFFDALRQVDISQVLAFAHQQCHCLEAFEHVLVVCQKCSYTMFCELTSLLQSVLVSCCSGI